MNLETFFDPAILGTIAPVVLSIIGTMQTFKQAVKLKDGRWYSLVMLGVAIAFSFVFLNPGLMWLQVSIVAWSLSQIAYDLLLKTIMKLIDKIDGDKDLKEEI